MTYIELGKSAGDKYTIKLLIEVHQVAADSIRIGVFGFIVEVVEFQQHQGFTQEVV